MLYSYFILQLVTFK